MTVATKAKKKSKGPRYEIREGFRISLPASVVGSVVEELRGQHGGNLTPEIVVDASRSPGAPLHSYFEWRDDVAAELHRRSQAGYLIRSYYVVQEARGERPETKHIANVSVRTEEGGRSYVSSHEAMSDTDMREQVIAEVQMMLRGIKSRYRHLPNLKATFLAALEGMDFDG